MDKKPHPPWRWRLLKKNQLDNTIEKQGDYVASSEKFPAGIAAAKAA